jgi:hypothetical protein
VLEQKKYMELQSVLLMIVELLALGLLLLVGLHEQVVIG